jgi:hypothetical protein
MTHAVDIYGGSYFQAAALCTQFNVRAANKKSEGAQVAAVLDAAADFLTSVMPQLTRGYELQKREPQPYIGYRVSTIVSSKIAGQLAAQALPGDSLGKVKVNAGLSTERKLQQISRAFGLASTADAARLAVSVYSTLQNVSERYGQIYLEKGQDVKKCPLRRLAKTTL